MSQPSLLGEIVAEQAVADQRYRLYEYNAKGHALSAICIVIDKDSKAAKRKAVRWCREKNVDPETLHLENSCPLTFPGVVYAFDGDY